MPISITLVLVVVLSVVMSGVFQLFLKERVALSGSEYLLVGLLLGPMAIDLLSVDVVLVLQPFVTLTLGVVGFHLGLGLRSHLKTAESIEAGLVSSLFCTAVVAAVFYGLFHVEPFSRIEIRDPLWLALTLGAAASAVSVRLLEGVIARTRAQGATTELLRSFSLAANLTAVAVAGFSLSISRAQQSSNRFGLTETEWVMASLGLGAAAGLLFTLFLGRKEDAEDERLFVAAVGSIVFISGLAAATGNSPLLLNALAGVLVAALSKDAKVLHARLGRLERPAMVALMIFAGAMWVPVSGYAWFLPVVYVALRTLVLRISAKTSIWAFPHLPRVQRLGAGLISQGSIAVAIAVTHAQVVPAERALSLAVVLTLLPVLDLLAPLDARRVLVDAGEHERVAVET